MEIHASCNYDLNAYKAITGVQQFGKRNPKTQKLVMVITYCTIVAVFILAMLMLDAEPDKETIFLAAMLVLMGIFAFVLIYLAPHTAYKNACKMGGISNSFVLRDADMSIETHNEGYSGSSTVRYDTLHKAYETSAYFVFFINKYSAYLIDKSTIEGDGVQQIKTAVSAVLGKKYIICNY